MGRGKRKRDRALARLRADHYAGDVSDEQLFREEQRIEAGTSRYLRGNGLLARAVEGDRYAWARLAVIGAVVLLVVIVGLVVLGVVFTDWDPANGGAPESDDDGFMPGDDFEGGDDDGD